MGFYLDDLRPPTGAKLRCRSDLVGAGFTPGNEYRVLRGGFVRDDDGTLVRPSARFEAPNPHGAHWARQWIADEIRKADAL